MGGPDSQYNQDAALPHIDRSFFQRIAEGDQVSFTILVSHYHKTVYTVAWKLTRSAPLSEDIVQDVFLKLWLKRAMLPGIENFPAYLYTISANTIYSYLRQKKRESWQLSGIDPEDTPWTGTDPASAMQDKEYGILLEKAIRRLPARQQQTYTLIKKQGMKREQAAAVLNISPETVKSNLDQAIKSIRAYCMAHLDLLIFLLLLLKRKD
jgi:RNA polymerase sigma-70 factor (ECF subfamily)